MSNSIDATDITKVNMVSPEVLECPYPYYERVREEAPVHQTPLGFWAVSRYEDVLSVVRNPEMFSSLAQSNSFVTTPPPEVIEIAKQGYPRVNTLLSNDPPSHTQFRNLVNKAFLPKRVAQLEDSIRKITNDLIDAFINDGKVDLVEQFAVGVPLTVIADALGVDRADMPKFKKWSDDSVAPLSGMLTPERQIECAHSRIEFQNYMVDRVHEREANLRDDLLSDLVQARFDSGERAGEGMTMAEMLDVIAQLLVAGNETTTKLIAAATLMLIENPEQMAKVRADHSLIPNLVEEALRMEAPVQMLPRFTKEDVEVGGVAIPKGSVVMVMYGCANRDGAKYPNPDMFDIERDNARTQMAFGQGPHFCVGAALARSEARIAFELLLSRLNNIALASVDTPTHRELSMTLRGLTNLHLTFTPA
ncbi:MAG: cytochrome P450 [Ilumatobacteraceae bacterium]|nr:cytochrome P450 [Ilumatobacteraceae bacterium]NQW59863.1 cytochrome P450 [bacterium]